MASGTLLFYPDFFVNALAGDDYFGIRLGKPSPDQNRLNYLDGPFSQKYIVFFTVSMT